MPATSSIHLARLVRLALAVLLACAATAVARPVAAGPAADLFFSEYVEGSSNNKALEVYNGTGAAITLTGAYDVQFFFNGGATAGSTLALNGTVAAGDVFVLAHSSAAAAILTQADQTSGGAWFNGNDAIALRRNGTVIDVIGQVGLDPGAAWGAGATSTLDHTLRRKPSVLAGDANGADAFDPAAEWDGFALDTFGGLGSHAISGGNAPIVPSCGGPLAAAGGAGATRAVTAADADGRVISALVSGISPAPAAGSIAIANVVPASGAGAALSATLSVSANVPAGSYDASIRFGNDDSPAPQTASCVVRVTVGAPAGSLRIHDIQGAGHVSPYRGLPVAQVPGVVTARRSNGFFMQDLAPDGSDATAEGIFVFTASAPAVSLGDTVAVSGTVAEFRPGGDAAKLTVTELDAGSPTSVAKTGTAAPPAPVAIGAGGRTPPTQVIEDDAGGDVEAGGTFDPASDGLDFYESLEGMLVRVNDAVAVGPTSSFGETPVLADSGDGASIRSSRGALVIRPDDFNPERVILSDALAPGAPPKVDVGDRFSQPIDGVVDYSFGNYKLLNLAPLPPVIAGGLAREVAAAPAADQLSVATFNVENLDPGDGQAKFDRLAGLIVNNLRAPDLIALEEVQDNNGATSDGTVDASQTLGKLIDAIAAAGGPAYQYRQIDPANNQDGGEPGGNIRQVFLFRTDRGLAFVDRPGGTATAATAVVSDTAGVHLSLSPGRINPTSTAFSSSRKPLAGEFSYRGRRLFAIANHFNSKGGDQPLFGRFQPPARSSEAQRGQQAQIVADFVASLLALDPSAGVIVLGDLNDYQFSTAVAKLKAAGLADLVETLPESERYSYVFEGNGQVLDHIMVSAGLRAGAAYDVVHVNAEFADQASDHDPSVALLGGELRVWLPLAAR
jgi:predicted extracellular nuclease